MRTSLESGSVENRRINLKMDLKNCLVRMGVDAVGSLCQVAGFGISGVEPSVSATKRIGSQLFNMLGLRFSKI